MSEPLEVEIVDNESTRVEIESIRESNWDEWLNPTTAYKLAGLTKSSFQRAIAHLLGVCGCRVDLIRLGGAKNTRYSKLAIELIKAYKSDNKPLLQQLLEFAVTKSADPTQSSLVVIDRIADLDKKIANLQRTTTNNSQLGADRVRQKLLEISRCQVQSQQRNDTLIAAELLAAENRGIEQALKIFEAEEGAKENALAHLRASKISGNQ